MKNMEHYKNIHVNLLSSENELLKKCIVVEWVIAEWVGKHVNKKFAEQKHSKQYGMYKQKRAWLEGVSWLQNAKNLDLKCKEEYIHANEIPSVVCKFKWQEG